MESDARDGPDDIRPVESPPTPARARNRCLPSPSPGLYHLHGPDATNIIETWSRRDFRR